MAKRQPVREQSLSKAAKYDDEKEYGENGDETAGGDYRMVKGKLTKCGGMDKSDLTEDDMQKSLDQLEQFANAIDPTSRQDALMQKSLDSGLSEDESLELMDLLGGGESEDESASFTKSFGENTVLQKALEVSSFLSAQHEELTKSLDMVGDRLDASDSRQHNFNLVLAKALAETGRLVKSLDATVQQMSEQPARGPKSRGTQRPPIAPLAKSFAGGGGDGSLSKAEMMGGLEGLYEDVIEKSGDSKLPDGTDLLEEISKFEQTSMMNPRVVQMVQRRLAVQRGAN